MQTPAVIVGVVLAIVLILLARRSGNYAKEKRIYAAGLAVAALIYVGLGFFSNSIRWMMIELLGVPVYALFAWLGLKKSGWFVALGWALHVFWDTSLHETATPFVPPWYIGLCLGFDVLVAGYVAVRELKKIERHLGSAASRGDGHLPLRVLTSTTGLIYFSPQ